MRFQIARISINRQGSDDLLDIISDIADVLSRRRFRTLMRRIGSLVEMQTRRRFDTQTGPDSVRWARRRGNLDPSRPVLTLTGLLRRSIRFETTDNSVSVGTDVPYAAFHQQQGRTIARNSGLSARPFLGLSMSDEREVRDLIEEFIDEILEG